MVAPIAFVTFRVSSYAVLCPTPVGAIASRRLPGRGDIPRARAEHFLAGKSVFSQWLNREKGPRARAQFPCRGSRFTAKRRARGRRCSGTGYIDCCRGWYSCGDQLLPEPVLHQARRRTPCAAGARVRAESLAGGHWRARTNKFGCNHFLVRTRPPKVAAIKKRRAPRCLPLLG